MLCALRWLTASRAVRSNARRGIRCHHRGPWPLVSIVCHESGRDGTFHGAPGKRWCPGAGSGPGRRAREVERVDDPRQPRESLALISTHWPSITDPMKFVIRYGPAIRGYLEVLLPTAADVDEV